MKRHLQHHYPMNTFEHHLQQVQYPRLHKVRHHFPQKQSEKDPQTLLFDQYFDIGLNLLRSKYKFV